MLTKSICQKCCEDEAEKRVGVSTSRKEADHTIADFDRQWSESVINCPVRTSKMTNKTFGRIQFCRDKSINKRCRYYSQQPH